MAKPNKTKEVYSYHPRTGEYTGPVEVKEGEEAPANSTEVKPNYPEGDEVLIFKDGKWIAVKADIFHLGETYREKRNAQLSGSDWSQLEDSKVDKKAWAEYRQALRDLPKQKEYPQKVEWPETPSSKPVEVKADKK